MNSRLEEVSGLLHKVAQGAAAIFVARRNDLDQGDNSTQMVLDDHAVGSLSVEVPAIALHDARDGPFKRRHAAVALRCPARSPAFNRQDIRLFRTCPLFNER